MSLQKLTLTGSGGNGSAYVEYQKKKYLGYGRTTWIVNGDSIKVFAKNSITFNGVSVGSKFSAGYEYTFKISEATIINLSGADGTATITEVGVSTISPTSGQRTLIDGVAHKIVSGKCLVDGTAYNIKQGKTLVDGTEYDIRFKRLITVEITNSNIVITRDASYITIDGVTYDSTPQTIVVEEGAEIVCYVYFSGAYHENTGADGTIATVPMSATIWHNRDLVVNMPEYTGQQFSVTPYIGWYKYAFRPQTDTIIEYDLNSTSGLFNITTE